MIDNIELLDDDVPHQAIEALHAAQIRAYTVGHPIVLIRDGKLIRICGNETTILKHVSPRFSVKSESKSVLS